MSDRAAMYAAFEEALGDVAGYAAMSDLLREEGLMELAHAFHWMSGRGIWPHKRARYCSVHVAYPPAAPGRAVPASCRWAWYGRAEELSVARFKVVRNIYPQEPMRCHALPKALLGAEQLTFPSHRAAVVWLSNRLAALKRVFDVSPVAESVRGAPLVDVLYDDR